MAPPTLRPFESLYRTLVRGAAKRHKFCDLSYEEFFEFTKIPDCHYCGAALIWRIYRHPLETIAYNLDYKNSSAGYTKDNLVTCCRRCNYGKMFAFTYEEWVLIGNLIRSWKK